MSVGSPRVRNAAVSVDSPRMRNATVSVGFLRMRKAIVSEGFLRMRAAVSVVGALLFSILLVPPSAASFLGGCGGTSVQQSARPQQAERRVFTDVLGHQVAWQEPPSRIVSLSPSLTEILFAVQCDAAVVGVTRFCNSPPAVQDLPKVGGVVDPSLESILMLQADLVLATRGNSLEFMESLVHLGIPIYTLETRGDLEQILQTILEVGKITGREEPARHLADSLRVRLDHVIERTAGLDPGARPRVYAGEMEGAHWTPGPGSFLHAVITAAGGKNIGSIAPSAWSPLSLEAIIVHDPEVCLGIFGPLSGGDKEVVHKAVLHILQSNEAWERTSLGLNPRIFLVHEDRLQRPGPRVFNVLEELARYLHPELWNREEEPDQERLRDGSRSTEK